MLRHQSILLALLLAVAVGCDDGVHLSNVTRHAAAVSATVAPTDELSTLCPEGALLFMKINRPAALEEEMVALASILDSDGVEPHFLTQSIGQQILNPTMAGADTTKPMAMALCPTATGQPLPVWFVAVSDKEAFLSAARSNPRCNPDCEPAFAGEYAVCTLDPSILRHVAQRPKPVPIARKLLHGDMSIAIDLVAIYDLVKPDLDRMISANDGAGAGPEGPPLAGMMKGFAEGLQTFFEGSYSLCLAASLDEGDVSFTLRYTAQPESEIAEAVATATPVAPTLMPLLGRSGFMTAEMHFSPETLWKFAKPFYEQVFAGDPELLDLMARSMSMSDGAAMGMGLSHGLEVTGVYRLTEPDSYLELTEKLLAKMRDLVPPAGAGAPVMPIRFGAGDEWEHEGVRVLSMRMQLDLSGLPPASPGETAMMDRIFGANGLEFHYAAVGEHGLFAGGPEARRLMKESIDRLKSGEKTLPPAGFEDATLGFPEETNALFFLNFADLVPLIAESGNEKLTDAQDALLQSPPPDLWAAGYVRSHEAEVDVGARVRLGAIFSFVRAVEDAKGE